MLFLTRYIGNKNGKVQKSSYDIRTKQVQEEHLKEETEKYKLDLHIPVILGIENKQLEKQVIDDIDKDKNNFVKELKQATNEYMTPNIPYFLESSYNIYNHDFNILSFCILYSNYYGGAHPMSHKICYNYDIKLGKRIMLKDLFNNELYKSFINKEIEKQIINRNEVVGYEVINAFKGIHDNQKFYIKNRELVIYFDLYDIAPYVAGIIEFTMPKEIF
jgi:hypothetical protein